MLSIFWPPVFLHCPIAPYRSTRKSGSVLFCESSATKQTFFFVSFEKEDAKKVFWKVYVPSRSKLNYQLLSGHNNNNCISISASKSCEKNKTTWGKAALILGSSCILLVFVFSRIQTQQVVHYPAPPRWIFAVCSRNRSTKKRPLPNARQLRWIWEFPWHIDCQNWRYNSWEPW